MYLLDTNVVSELRKVKPHGGLLAWIEGAREDALFLSAVTLGEVQAGIERTRRQDKAKAREIEAWLEAIAGTYQVLPMDAKTFREWARLMDRRPNHLFEDAMIAATARVHRLAVVTRNTRDFEGMGVTIVNPFPTP